MTRSEKAKRYNLLKCKYSGMRLKRYIELISYWNSLLKWPAGADDDYHENSKFLDWSNKLTETLRIADKFGMTHEVTLPK